MKGITLEDVGRTATGIICNDKIMIIANINSQTWPQTKWVLSMAIFQVVVIVLFCVFVRYDPSIDAKTAIPNEVLEYDSYPWIMDIQVMLFVGFGFLMTFLPRFGYSAVCFTMIITVCCVEWGILVTGFLNMEHETMTIHITWLSALEGGFAAATVLITFGAILGKTNPLQLFFIAIVETTLFCVNSWIGYILLQTVDGGGSIFIHSLGAYFGLAVSLADRKRDYDEEQSSARQNTNHISDDFSLLGTLMLWIYWPSFNSVLASNLASRTRASLNTYLSMTASTVTCFLLSAALGDDRKFYVVDGQNASLAGGVAMGAIANFMVQPYAAIIIGSAAGLISCYGYRVLQGGLQDLLNVHDSCGVNNLHGIPGVLSALLSILYSAIASKEEYGDSLYIEFPAMAPSNQTLLAEIQKNVPSVSAGLDRTPFDQAMIQLLALGITLAVALIGGWITGVIATNDWLFNVLRDDELFEDGYFFNLSDGDIIEVNMDSSVGTAEHTLEPLGQIDNIHGVIRMSEGSIPKATVNDIPLIMNSNGETVRHRPRSRQSGNVSPMYGNDATINTISGR